MIDKAGNFLNVEVIDLDRDASFDEELIEIDRE